MVYDVEAVMRCDFQHPVLALIHTTHTQLVKHQIYRELFLNLKCLNSLYESRQGHKPTN